METICICGAGTMGSGIAMVAAQSGFRTILFDVDTNMLEKAGSVIAQNLQSQVEKGRISIQAKNATISNIRFTFNISDCVADVIIEAIIEKQEAKVELLNQLARFNKSETIFTSNTSSLSITSIALQLVKPSQFAGMHFFNPPALMKLVEVIKGYQTADEVIKVVHSLAERLGKTPVICKDSPGFIVNRVARPYYLEALRLAETNGIEIETIDQLMEASGFKMGPFKLMDLIGIDINYEVSNIVWNALGKPERLMPSGLQKKKVDDRELGKKTGKGFYEY